MLPTGRCDPIVPKHVIQNDHILLKLKGIVCSGGRLERMPPASPYPRVTVGSLSTQSSRSAWSLKLNKSLACSLGVSLLLLPLTTIAISPKTVKTFRIKGGLEAKNLTMVEMNRDMMTV
ncbi:hypothetical protein TcWFU_002087 [Taenia crassiceps]|uniref:Uncharacterized protein n=1 Tax=Taenia crassiceps TaxID=6207 RepID=A0ABR4QKB9_9CEST